VIWALGEGFINLFFLMMTCIGTAPRIIPPILRCLFYSVGDLIPMGLFVDFFDVIKNFEQPDLF
jgi:hypothetical protein